ncbi:hypothetical protein DPV74_06335 [Burkholderia sp. HAN2018]|nr:hypothetical protein [Burkholderia sp. HAN2018]
MSVSKEVSLQTFFEELSTCGLQCIDCLSVVEPFYFVIRSFQDDEDGQQRKNRWGCQDARSNVLCPHNAYRRASAESQQTLNGKHLRPSDVFRHVLVIGVGNRDIDALARGQDITLVLIDN